MPRLLAPLALLVIALPLAAQETRFTRELRPGDRLEISNINGGVEVTQGTGRTAEVVVTKTVKRGDGDMVKAIMEEEQGVMRVCTIFLNRNPNRSSCSGDNSVGRGGRGDRDQFEVVMHYEVRVPAGVRFEGGTVNGSLTVRGLDTPATISTVNGSISYDGVGAHQLETVNGAIDARFTRAAWTGTTTLSTVNGAITLSLPESADVEIDASTVSGGFSSDFPGTVSGRWGPKDFRATLGKGGRELELETVNGGIRIRKL